MTDQQAAWHANRLQQAAHQKSSPHHGFSPDPSTPFERYVHTHCKLHPPLIACFWLFCSNCCMHCHISFTLTSCCVPPWQTITHTYSCRQKRCVACTACSRRSRECKQAAHNQTPKANRGQTTKDVTISKRLHSHMMKKRVQAKLQAFS
jgi:hypothetical protein